MSTLRTLGRLVLVAGLLAAPVLVARVWKRSRTQIHSIDHGRG